MTPEEQIVQALKTIDQYSCESMIDNLLHQGAFPEIIADHASVEVFGINIEKRRTIKSSPRADAELTLKGIVVESSVQEDWRSKFSEVLAKNKRRRIKKFVFCTNQDVGQKQIKVKGESLNAEEYCCNTLECENSFVIGQRDLVLRLQDPRYFYIRRNFLHIPDDFFYSVSDYRYLLKTNDSFTCEVKEPEIEIYSNILANALLLDPNRVVLLHNDDYITLLHTISMWGSKLTGNDSQKLINSDLCFIRWPHNVVGFVNVSATEINDYIQTIIFIWGAHEISNLSEFLMFNKRNAMLVFVCKSAFKEKVREKLEAFGTRISVFELHIPEIDERKITADEQEIHRRKIAAIVENLTDLLLKYEALIYFYSPLYLEDRETEKKIRNILNIDQTQASQLNNLLLKNDLASITGRILWLKQPIVAKDLLNNYIDENVFPINDLMA